MITSCRFWIYHEALVIFIFLSAFSLIFFAILCEIVFVHKIVACVIRWIDINNFDFAEIAFL